MESKVIKGSGLNNNIKGVDNMKKLEDYKLTSESKSGKMRELYFDKGVEIKVISKLLNVRYQFVYNVISRERNRRDSLELKKLKGESK